MYKYLYTAPRFVYVGGVVSLSFPLTSPKELWSPSPSPSAFRSCGLLLPLSLPSPPLRICGLPLLSPLPSPLLSSPPKELRYPSPSSSPLPLSTPPFSSPKELWFGRIKIDALPQSRRT